MVDLRTPESSEVLVVPSADVPYDLEGPVLIGSLPGSLFLREVDEAWRRRGSLTDLASVGGPWGVIVARGRDRWIVTDPMGLQPVFWARIPRGDIAVASWLAALVDRPDVSEALDYEGILLREGRGRGHAVAQRTDFAAVSVVPAGHALHVSGDGRARLVRYFDPADLPGPDPSLSLADCAHLLRTAVDAAVRRLTPTNAPVGAHVSGGLDCTSVACRAQQLLQEGGSGLVAGYSWTPDIREVPRFDGDERSLLDDVTISQDLAIRPVSADERGDWFTLRDPYRYPASTLVRERYVLPTAAHDGVKVMLSGWGGDELASFNGRAVTKHLVRHGNLLALWSESWSRAALASPPSSRYRRVANAAEATVRSVAGHLPDAASPWRWRRRAQETRKERQRLRVLAAYSPLAAEVARDWTTRINGVRDHHEYQLALLSSGHIQHRVQSWYQSGRLFDINYRYPLLDLDVVTTALRLPWWAYRSQGWSRIAYRLAVEPWVPANVAWNPRKLEPALFWPPVKFPAPRSRPEPPEPAVTDPELARVRALIKSSQPPPGQPVDPGDGVRPRPDAAPTLRQTRVRVRDLAS